MPVTMGEVLSALSAIEPRYEKIAQFGQDALPHLDVLVEAQDLLLASKATCLAAAIGGELSLAVLRKASESIHPEVRLATAAAIGSTPIQQTHDLILKLLDDDDSGVRKFALYSIPDGAPQSVKVKIEAMKSSDSEAFIRSMANSVLGAVAFDGQ